MRMIDPVVKLLLPLWVLLCCTRLSAQTGGTKKSAITLFEKQAPLSEVLAKIQQQSGSLFAFNHELVNTQPRITVRLSHQPLQVALDRVLSQTTLSYSIEDGMIVIYYKGQGSGPATQQTGALYNPKPAPQRLYGIVRSEDQQLMENVSVYNTSRGTGTVTDSSGRYHIEAGANDILVFTHIGFHPFELVADPATTGRRDIRLSEHTPTAEAIIVSGYQRIERKMNTGAVPATAMAGYTIPGISTIDGMLGGRVAGLQVSNSSGGVGASPKLRLRGTATFVGNREPVWVVDGVVQDEPLLLNGTVQSVEQALSNMQGNAISGLNPNDIEIINFLKDASAASIYGVRGANGVIVITTKKGTESSKPQFSFSTDAGIVLPPRQGAYNRMNTAQRIDASASWMDAGLPLPEAYGPDSYEAYALRYRKQELDEAGFNAAVSALRKRNTDWMDKLFRPALQRQHYLQASGGNRQWQYYASIGLNNNDGAAIGESLQRQTANLRITARPFKKVTLDAGLKGFSRQVNGFFSTNPFDYAWMASSAVDPNTFYLSDRNTFTNFSSGEERRLLPYNFLYERNNTGSKTRSRQLQVQLNTSWQITPSLEWKGLAALSGRSDAAAQWAAPYSWYAMQAADSLSTSGRGIRYQQENFTRSTMLRQSLSYNARLAGRSELVAMTGTEYRTVRQGATHTVILSAFTTGAWNIGERFVLNGSLRTDASNQFTAARRALFTYSAGARWNIASEKFLANNRIIRKLDVRATYGTQGNLVPAMDGRLKLAAPESHIDELTGENVLTLTSLSNQLLRWERTHTFNLGMDLQLFSNRFQLTADYYAKRGTDLLLEQQIAYEYGIRSIYLNAATLQNRGVELALQVIPVRIRKFEWSVGINLSRNMNRAGTTGAGAEDVLENIYDHLHGRQVIAGKPVSGFYAFRFNALDPSNGLPLIGLDGSVTDEPSRYLAYQGQLEPVYSGGMESQLRYHKLRLQVAFNTAWGHRLWLAPLYPNITGVQGTPMPYQNLSAEETNRWTSPGDEKHTSIPSVTTEDGQVQAVPLPGGIYGNAYTLYDHSDVRVVPGWFLRCSYLLLGWELPENKLKKCGLRGTEIRLSGNNLFVMADSHLAGRDPETGGYGGSGLPVLPSVHIGFTTKF